MTPWLVVHLEAPFASFGSEAGNAVRGSDATPTRSALLGLAGAALGLRRDDDAGQAALGAAFRTATRHLDNGRPLEDFHTFQSLPATDKGVASRADALSRKARLVTAITHRAYRMDGCWQAAYRLAPGAALTLEALEAAFRSPAFVLYLGRKSCPLAHPLAPRIIKEVSVAQAFEAYWAEFVSHRRDIDKARDIPLDWEIAVDHPADLPEVNTSQRRTRLDDPRDRQRWHFSSRPEWTFTHRPETSR